MCALITSVYLLLTTTTKEKISEILAEYGLGYLKGSKFLYENQHRAIDDAIELSKQITISFARKRKSRFLSRGERINDEVKSYEVSDG